MSELPVSKKAMKLVNVLFYTMVESDFQSNVQCATQMENYIKSKGYQPLGPIIQYSGVEKNTAGEPEMVVRLLRQANGYINHTETPYSMESVLRVPNCLYVRYRGPMEKLQVAYSKLAVVAFENDINLRGDSYTIFVDQLENEDIIADVFMEMEHE
ncbi:MAG: hypothetical protein VB035_14565 [Candidatus Fimivivens sp.]|nr:hypothetical protein [Candidatus Fimivivens sp.]